MSSSPRILLLVLSAALSAFSHAVSSKSQALAATESEGAERVPGEYVVTLEAGEKEGAITERYGRLGIKRVLALGGGVYLLNITIDPGPREMETLIKPDKRIKTVQPNLIYRADGAGKGVKN
jgi:hypothetical protein